MAKQRRRGKTALTCEYLIPHWYGFRASSRAKEDLFGNQAALCSFQSWELMLVPMLEPGHSPVVYSECCCRRGIANGYSMSDDVGLTLIHGEADELAGHE
jgi:hypothetical protein